MVEFTVSKFRDVFLNNRESTEITKVSIGGPEETFGKLLDGGRIDEGPRLNGTAFGLG